jgi:hypothetical protein
MASLFARILYMNLDKRPDRRRRVEEVLDLSDLRDIHRVRVPAVDGTQLTPKDLERLISPTAMNELRDLSYGSKLRQHHSQLTVGGVGCFLTHLRIWELVAQDPDGANAPVLVLEDDARLPPDTGALFQTGLQQFLQLPQEPKLLLWMFIHCDYSGPQVSPTAPVLPLVEPWWCLQAYTLTPRTARSLLSHPGLKVIDVQIDSALQLLPDVSIFGCSRLAVTNDGSTNIQAHIAAHAPLYRPGLKRFVPVTLTQSGIPQHHATPTLPKIEQPAVPADTAMFEIQAGPVTAITVPKIQHPPRHDMFVPLLIVLVVVVVLALGLGLGLGLGLDLKRTPKPSRG